MSKRYTTVEQKPEVTAPPAIIEADPRISDISIDDLIGKHLLMIYRDTRAMMREGIGTKLSKDSSQCLRDNLKLLLELKDREKDILEALSTDELEKLAKDET